MPTFNSKQFAWSDIRVFALGRDITGLQGIKYKFSEEKEYVYGRGKAPLSIQSGNQAVEGTLTLLQSEVEEMVTAAKTVNPAYKLTSFAFDIVVTYGDGANAKTDVIKGAEITEYEKGMEQNDKFMAIELPFMALDVVEQA